jgi:hypothetical protein
MPRHCVTRRSLEAFITLFVGLGAVLSYTVEALPRTPSSCNVIAQYPNEMQRTLLIVDDRTHQSVQLTCVKNIDSFIFPV